MGLFGASKPAPAVTGNGLQNGELFGKSDAVATTSKPTEQQQIGWRDRLPIHPAALFPLMNKDELRELADDIKQNGLKEQVKYVYDEEKQVNYLLDGRNRLDALELLGRGGLLPGSKEDRDMEIFDEVFSDDDPVAYVISKNVHRRHLKPEQKRDLIVKLLKLDPERSNRARVGARCAQGRRVGACVG